MGHTNNRYANPMKTVQLAPNLRFVGLTDESGAFGLIIAHTGETVHYTIQVETYDELRAAVESFQANPVGQLV